MNKRSVYNLFYFAAAFLLLVWIVVTVNDLHNWGGWLLMLFFLSLAIAFRGHKFLKGFSYTVMIFVKMVVIPVAAGMAVHYLLKGRANWLNKILPVTSMFGIVLILVIIIAKGRDALLQVGGLIILATFIHNTFGYLLDYWSGRLFKFNERDSRTIALEVGMQNAGLASALALKISTNPAVALAPAIFGPLMNITGSILSSWWHNRVPKDDPPDEKRRLIKKKC